jgi:hypothetical protein
LEQLQLVHAVTIADMVHAEAAVQQAVRALATAAESEQGLSAAALQLLAGLHAHLRQDRHIRQRKVQRVVRFMRLAG